MDTSTLITVTGSFLKFVGETLADVKSRDGRPARPAACGGVLRKEVQSVS
jgi:hypothetical protein